MDLATEKLKQLDNPTLTMDDRAVIRCHVAADMIHTGQYEAARDVLGDLWCGVGQRPNIKNLKAATAGEVLLQAGVLFWMDWQRPKFGGSTGGS